MAKKLKNEKALLKLALDMILADAVKRGVVEFDATVDSEEVQEPIRHEEQPGTHGQHVDRPCENRQAGTVGTVGAHRAPFVAGGQ